MRGRLVLETETLRALLAATDDMTHEIWHELLRLHYG